jgi:hypothetical protein
VTDAELIVASRHDPAAFRELYDRWADKLLAWCYRRVFDAEVAADLLAETFAVAFERRHRFRDTAAPGRGDRQVGQLRDRPARARRGADGRPRAAVPGRLRDRRRRRPGRQRRPGCDREDQPQGLTNIANQADRDTMV